MSNVVLLFAKEGLDVPLDPDSPLDETVIRVMSSSATLESRLQDLCRHLDAVDRVIDHLDDVALQRSLRHQTRAGRQALAQAKQDLHDELRKLPVLRRRAADQLTRN